MLTDLRVVLPNRPGALVAAIEALARAEVGIEGICGDTRAGETWGALHVLVADEAAARGALEEIGCQVSSDHAVDVIETEMRPGALAKALRVYSDRDENIELAYMATHSRIVIGTEAMRPERPGVKVSDTL